MPTVPADAKATQIADALTALENVPANDREKVDRFQMELLARLRTQVKVEVQGLHQRALIARMYREGFSLVRQAGEIIALYPISNDSAVVAEAEDLSIRQKEVGRRVEMLRRQRYNRWAAEQLEKSLDALRSKDVATAQILLGSIDASLLEIAVSSLYSYTVTEIADKLDKDKKAQLAKALTDSSIVRRGMEDF